MENKSDSRAVLALKNTLLQILAVVGTLVAVGLLIGFIAGVIWVLSGDSPLPEYGKWIFSVVVIFCLLFAINYVKGNNFQDSAESWKKNTGEAPSAKRVNAQYSSGKIDWNVCPDSLDWSLDVEDPITTWMNKS